MTHLSSPEPALVLHVTTVPETLYRLFGGLLAAHRRAGYRVEAACSGGTRVHAEAVARVHDITVHPVRLTRELNPLRDLVALGQLVLLMWRRRPAVVHSHTPKGGLLGLLAAVFTLRPLRIYTVRGAPYLTATGLTRIALLTSEWIACRCAHRVVAVSHSLRAELVGRRLCPAAKIIVVGAGSGQGVDAERRFIPQPRAAPGGVREQLGIDAEAVVLGFVGRLARDKGLEELVAVWSAVRDRHPTAVLIIAGADAEPRAQAPVQALERLVADPRVHRVGNVEDIERYYAAMDVLVFPSHREGFPNAVLEASAMRLPTVVFDVVGSRDAVVHGETGYITPLGDVPTFTEHTLALITCPDLRASMGTCARDRVLRDFRPEPICDAVVALYGPTRVMRPTGAHEAAT